ncbi:unnamed protein product [Sphenostylis stenocarpa]|uniref:Uncharacterized protein n=1 Tax=Sphenostylis stenocarpa TaxID=92480 RepID=A0AA86VPS9_9FABA|nr:unnamed protein product [Sphenostylis stenocarpa]
MSIVGITVVNPALDKALEILQKFSIDVHNGQVSKDKLRFGAAWRHPPQIDDPKLHMEWAKLQLMDFVHSLANTEFAVCLEKREPTLVTTMSFTSSCALTSRSLGMANENQEEENILWVNYRSDYSEEVFDDPSTVALLQVGLLYAQRDPPFIRPTSKGIQRCLVRWLVEQRMQMNSRDLIHFVWHRIMRGRYYRHLMVQIGYK